MENTNSPAGSIIPADFGYIDFLDEANFEQFIDLVRGQENTDPIVNFGPKIDCDNISGCFDDSHFVVPTQENLFDFVVEPSNCALTDLPGVVKVREEENDGEVSSGTTTTTTATTNTAATTTTTTPPAKRSTKADRSRTLISERRRRGRMKERLYALRALVPNITKMDKASIIGDAVLYVQELQSQAKKLRAEIAGLESSSSLKVKNKNQRPGSFRNDKMMNNSVYGGAYTTKKIMQIEVFQVEERGYYVRVVCQKGRGVASSLYKALHSFNIQSSNLATADQQDYYTLTFTFKDKEGNVEMDLPGLKLWIATSFLNQGFDFESSVFA